jgi:uncharacterized protein (DUF302 family)
VKYLPIAALLVGLMLPASVTYGQDVVVKDRGIVTIPSNHSVDETVDRLKSVLQSRNIILFALIDHSGEAAKV